MPDMEINARITAETEGFEEGVERVKRSSEELEASVKRTSKSIERDADKATASVKKDADGLKGKIGELVRATEEGSNRIGKAVSMFAGIGLAMNGVKQVADMARRVYDTSMQMARLADTAADTAAYMRRTFGSMTSDATEWAHSMADAYGLYTQEVEALYTQMYEALSKSLPSVQADEIAQGLTKLRYDIAAVLKWYDENQIQQWVVDVVMKGEQEPFQRLMAGQTFEQAAKAAGMWSDSMTDAQKKTTMARLLMREYSDEVGTWTANLETASGAEARLSASIEELQTSLGQVLSPVLAGVINQVADLVDRFDDMVSAVNGLLGLGSSVDATSADLIREVSRAMDQLADSTRDASEASAGLAGFDKLNRLADKSGEGSSEDKDFADGLDSWMRLWALDADAATTAADRLWDSILDSGLDTERELRGEFGDLFAWMADRSELDVSVKQDAVDKAWRSMESVISKYRERLSALGVKETDMARLAESSSRYDKATSQEASLTSELERLRRSGGSEESMDEIERELADVRRTIKDTTADARLYQAVVSLRTTYGSAIQGLYATLANDLGAYTGEIAASLSSATREEIDASWSAVQEAIQSIPAPVVNVEPYDDTQLYADASKWINDNYAAVQGVLAGIPNGSGLSAILDEFKEAGFDVTDPTVSTAVETLAANLSDLPAPVVNVEQYDDAQLYRDASKWINDNYAAVQGVLAGIPNGSGLSAILDEFKEAGFDVTDPTVSTAVETLAANLSDLPAPVVNVEQYDDAQLYRDASQWIADNYAAIHSVLEGIPDGAGLSAILDSFKEAGFDVADPAVSTAVESLATSVAGMEITPDVHVDGDTITYSPPDIDITNENTNINHNQNINNVDTDPIATAMQNSIKDLDVKSQVSVTVPEIDTSGIETAMQNSIKDLDVKASVTVPPIDTTGIETAMQNSIKDLDVKATANVTVQEHDYSDVFQGIGQDVGGGLSDVAGAVDGITVPDYTSIIDQIKTDVGEIKGDMDTVAETSATRAIPDAEKAVQDARDKASQDLDKATDKLTDLSTWTNPVDLAGTLVETITDAVKDLGGIGQAEKDLKAAIDSQADEWADVEARLRERGASDTWVQKFKEYFDQGQEFGDVYLHHRKRLETTYGVSSTMWNSALAGAKAKTQTPAVQTPTQTPASAGPSSSYFARLASGESLPYSSIMARYDEMGMDWSQIPDYIRESMASRGITGWASGGVFEPNQPVLGVLGDNRREVEVAAPYSTIVKAVREALGSSSEERTQSIELTANVVLDGRTVAKAVYPYIVREGRRLGA